VGLLLESLSEPLPIALIVKGTLQASSFLFLVPLEARKAACVVT